MCFCAQKIIMPFYICLRVIVEILKYMLCITNTHPTDQETQNGTILLQSYDQTTAICLPLYPPGR